MSRYTYDPRTGTGHVVDGAEKNLEESDPQPKARALTREETIALLDRMLHDPKSSYVVRSGTYVQGQRTVLQRVRDIIASDNHEVDENNEIVSVEDL